MKRRKKQKSLRIWDLAPVQGSNETVFVDRYGRYHIMNKGQGQILDTLSFNSNTMVVKGTFTNINPNVFSEETPYTPSIEEEIGALALYLKKRGTKEITLKEAQKLMRMGALKL